MMRIETIMVGQMGTNCYLDVYKRQGPQTAKKLEQNGMFTMGDVARCSVGKINQLHNEELLYRLFGINAELIIDHAWGWEPCTICLLYTSRCV